MTLCCKIEAKNGKKGGGKSGRRDKGALVWEMWNEKRGKQVKRKEESGKRSTSGVLSGMWEGRQRGGAVLAQTNLSPHS